QIAALIAQGLWLVRKHRPEVIWAQFPYEHNLIAAYCVSRLTGIPLDVYMHDLWEENRTGADLWLARRFESRVMAYARRVYAINSPARDHYIGKYGLRDVRVLLHAVDTSMAERRIETIEDETLRSVFASGKKVIL